MADTLTAAPVLSPSDDGSVMLPDGRSLADAQFELSDGDLLVSWSDGFSATVDDFSASMPELVDSSGIEMSGDMAVQLAQIDTPSEPSSTFSFEAIDGEVIGGTDGEPIGNVEDVEGSVFAIRVDGTRVELEMGDPVFQGDILESGADGSIGVILADETTFSMGEDGRMVLDEMIYDPETQDGSVSVSVLQGVFTFVSGQVAKIDPDAMTIDTPVATIGIRGTQVGINLQDGEDMDVVLMEEADGFVGEVVIQNDGGVVILNTAYAGTNVGSYDSAPEVGFEVDRAEFLQNYGASLKALPGVNNANTYGLENANLDLLIEEAVQELEEAALEAETEEGLVGELTGEGEEGESEQGETEVAEAELEAEGETEVEPDAVEELEPEPDELDIDLADDLVPDVIAPDSSIFFAFDERDDLIVGTDEPVFGDIDDREETVAEEEVVIPLSAEELFANELGGQLGGGFNVSVGAGGSYNVTADAGQVFNHDLSGSSESYNITASYGDDTILLGSGTDFVYSGDGDDTVEAGAGDDQIQGGTGGGDDTYIGGEGSDWVIYPSAKEEYDLLINLSTASQTVTLTDENGDDYDVTIDPSTATDHAESGDPTWIDTDTITEIENVLAGEGDDVIVGSSDDNVLIGNWGDDTIFAGDGSDILIGGSTYDNQGYNANSSSVSGNEFVGDVSAVLSEDGDDYLDGGAGYDYAKFGGSFADGDYQIGVDDNNNVTVTSVINGLRVNVDTLANIEELQFDNGENIVVGLPPVLTLDSSSINADADAGYTALGISAALDTNEDTEAESELGNITIEGIPNGTTIKYDGGELFSSTDTGGQLIVTPEQLAGLSILPPDDSASFALTVTVERGDTIAFTDSDTLLVNIDPTAGAPDLSVTDLIVEPDRSVTFDLSATVTDTSEIISEVTISGFDPDSKVYIPTEIGGVQILLQISVVNGVASIPTDRLGSVIIETPDDVDGTYDLVVTATAQESNDSTATATTTTTITVDTGEILGTDIDGTDGDDTLTGTSGDDRILGLDGDDTIDGGAGNDEIYAGDDDDTVDGGTGDDYVVGGTGNDTLSGDTGDDELIGGAGNDTLNGDDGADILNGGAGIDALFGGADADTLIAGAGDDTLTGGTGNDTLTGGDGDDTFMFNETSGMDIIKDITSDDTIVFDGQTFDADDLIFSENEDGDVEIAFSGNSDVKVTLEDTKFDDLDTDGDGTIAAGEGYSVSEANDQVTITIDTDT